ncbi:WXG100 family type VII secretion target [Nocardia amikacinitolerans]|uniref:WXG100 family type VII secretion target n=1 Tax=Nocardia amikacinitolerans TaxID=756689 RepID=A0A285LSW8_9NOCA|nr:WXG100 family type VII secretion target [Nocardia amikacinitolerans]MCP2289279.1 WXG100 family type VII secretion target [Nocardia amikacinitolerans]MCP2317612.1 WXG100 family type VII secretion target [Nocardia amikacinitolerans]SNY87988.1 WXG100 family type VII secretion target [Nocardia amikacinitolerans]
MSKPISANFSGVESGAQQIIKRAEGIRDELEAFHKKVEQYVADHGAGAANEAFSELQRNWQNHVLQLQQTLNGAAQLVSTGNSELQGTDSALANLF